MLGLCDSRILCLTLVVSYSVSTVQPTVFNASNGHGKSPHAVAFQTA